MATGIQSWSKTAASNATADSNVNWAEGQAPSSVNDSSRAEMASAAMWRDDINCSIDTGGTSTAFTATSNQSFASLTALDNAIIGFTPHTTSGDAPTLAVDGLTAKKIRFTTGNDLPAGALVQGTPYQVRYEHGVGEFLVLGLGSIDAYMPIGASVEYWGTTLPSSAFAFMYGQEVSRTTYATLFARLSTTHGVGNGSSTFNLPDCRGRVVAGKDDMGGSSANRLTNQTGGLNGDTLGATGGAETHTLTAGQAPVMSGTGTGSGTTSSVSGSNFAVYVGTTAVTPGGSSVGAVNDSGVNALSVTVSSLSVTVNAAGGAAHNNVQPTIVANMMIRIL